MPRRAVLQLSLPSLCPCCHPFVRCHYDTSCYNGAFRFCGCFHCGAFRLCGCLYFCGTRRRLYEHGHCHCVCDTFPTCSSHAIGFSDAPCWSFYWSSSPHPTFACWPLPRQQPLLVLNVMRTRLKLLWSWTAVCLTAVMRISTGSSMICKTIWALPLSASFPFVTICCAFSSATALPFLSSKRPFANGIPLKSSSRTSTRSFDLFMVFLAVVTTVFPTSLIVPVLPLWSHFPSLS